MQTTNRALIIQLFWELFYGYFWQGVLCPAVGFSTNIASLASWKVAGCKGGY